MEKAKASKILIYRHQTKYVTTDQKIVLIVKQKLILAYYLLVLTTWRDNFVPSNDLNQVLLPWSCREVPSVMFLGPCFVDICDVVHRLSLSMQNPILLFLMKVEVPSVIYLFPSLGKKILMTLVSLMIITCQLVTNTDQEFDSLNDDDPIPLMNTFEFLMSFENDEFGKYWRATWLFY